MKVQEYNIIISKYGDLNPFFFKEVYDIFDDVKKSILK